VIIVAKTRLGAARRIPAHDGVKLTRRSRDSLYVEGDSGGGCRASTQW
jgi:hypothetical protein